MDVPLLGKVCWSYTATRRPGEGGGKERGRRRRRNNDCWIYSLPCTGETEKEETVVIQTRSFYRGIKLNKRSAWKGKVFIPCK
jgi:hypothetical protein